MFGKFGDMMGKLQEMKQKADEAKQNLDNTLISCEGASGDIKIEITGNKLVKFISISPALQHGDKEELEKHLLSTINKAIEKAEAANQEEMKKAASGLLPGIK